MKRGRRIKIKKEEEEKTRKWRYVEVRQGR